MPKLIIFTDLDGSLLDHYNYSHKAAENTLEKLEYLGIPVVFNTSKTFSEQIVLRETINNRHPFIAENGAAIYLPKVDFMHAPEGTSDMGDYWVKEFCKPRSYWQKLIRENSNEFASEFNTFGDHGYADIMEWTGLTEPEAKLAMQRHYGEPVRWHGTTERGEEFKEKLKANGATVLQGGRFIHVSGASDKGVAMNWLSDLYRQLDAKYSEALTLAIGDGPNDAAMLEAADYSLVIKSPENPAPKLSKTPNKAKTSDKRITANQNESILYSESFGPEGWAEGVEKILLEMNIN